MAGKVAAGSIAGGIALLACIVVLSALAFVNRGVQYASFLAGRRLMTLASAVTTVAQGAMCAWLSFWLPAYFMRSDSPKPVMCVGLLAAGAAGLVVLRIFKRVVSHNEMEGKVLAQATRRWGRNCSNTSSTSRSSGSR